MFFQFLKIKKKIISFPFELKINNKLFFFFNFKIIFKLYYKGYPIFPRIFYRRRPIFNKKILNRFFKKIWKLLKALRAGIEIKIKIYEFLLNNI